MRPNVCVVVLDAVRSANLSCYGHSRPTTPTIDALAETAVRFENAYAPTGVTIDSVTSLLSGLYPAEHQSGRAGRMNADGPVLPELLEANGYRTGAVTCNPFISPAFGFDRGVDVFHPMTQRFERGRNVRKFFSETKHLPARRRYLRFLRESLDRDLPYHLGNALQFKFGLFEEDDDGAAGATRRARAFVESRDDPWFLYLHYTETHMNSAGTLPYSLPGDGASRFLDADVELDPDRLQTHSGPVDYDPETRDVHERLYDAAIRYLDGHVDALVTALEDADQWEETLFVVTADHGELLGERGLLGHGELYEPAVRVPLLIKLPDGDRGGERIADRINTRHLYRAILDVVGVDAPRPGPTLLETRPDVVITQDYSNTWDWSRYGGGDAGASAVYADAMKLIARGDEEELYDLVADPGESRNLAADRPERAAELRDLLLGRLERMDRPRAVDGAAAVPEDTRGRLEDLGYLE